MSSRFALRPASLAVLLALSTSAYANEASLPTVKVDATAPQTEQTATSPVKGYVAKRSATVTKTDTPIVETPQSVSVVGAEEIKAIGAKTMLEALSYTPGIINQNGTGPSTESYFARGFAQKGRALRDGVQLGGPWGMASAQEIYGLERVEYLKGAASVLYGQQSPGGIINTVSKRPRTDLTQELAVEYGSFDHKVLKADLGGQFSDNFLWRLTALGKEAGSQVDYVNHNRLYIAPSLLWNISSDTSLTFMPFYQKGTDGDYPVFDINGTILSNPWGKFPRSRFVGEPGIDNKDRNENAGFTVEFDHKLSTGGEISIDLRSSKSKTHFNATSVTTLQPDMKSSSYYAMRDLVNKDRNHALDLHLQQGFGTGEVRHKILAGISHTDQKLEGRGQRLWISDAGIIDLFNPDYSVKPDLSSAFSMGDTVERQTDTALYLQDQISIGEKWRVLLGGRQSWIKQKDELAGAAQRNQQFSANAGVVYLGANGIAPYASFSQSFQQEIGKLRDGSAMKPTEGEQFEAGIRWQPRGEDGLLLSLSTYQLTKTNVAKSDPDHPMFMIQVGEIRSRGVELEAKGSFTKHLSGSIGYAYTDTRTTRSTKVSEIGQRTDGVPLHQASAWLDVDGGLFNLAGLKLGAGVRYVGKLSIAGETFSAPANTELDARLQYKLRNWQYDLNVTNLLDKVGYTNCSKWGCGFTKARTITGSVAYRF